MMPSGAVFVDSPAVVVEAPDSAGAAYRPAKAAPDDRDSTAQSRVEF
jgi:hypothetical protein